MKKLRYKIWYSEGPGTSRYLCAEFETLDAVEGYIKHYDAYNANWEVVDTHVDTQGQQ